jgi:LysM repeat protein
VAEEGGWRLDAPSRDHRCGAFSPAAPLAPEKQSRLCLTPGHTKCATYMASLSARTERIGAGPVRRTTRWGLSRTTSVIEDRGGLRARFLAAVLDRRRWPAIPAVILVTTLFVLALSGFRAGVATSPVATASAAAAAASLLPTPHATTIPSATLQAAPTQPAPSATLAAPATVAPTAVPASPRPSASFRTYTVRSGDTLGEIASRFDTTVSAIARLNNISDPGRLQVGQVLRIP